MSFNLSVCLHVRQTDCVSLSVSACLSICHGRSHFPHRSNTLTQRPLHPRSFPSAPRLSTDHSVTSLSTQLPLSRQISGGADGSDPSITREPAPGTEAPSAGRWRRLRVTAAVGNIALHDCHDRRKAICPIPGLVGNIHSHRHD